MLSRFLKKWISILLKGWQKFVLRKQMMAIIFIPSRQESHVLKSWRHMSLPNCDLWKLILDPSEQILVFKSFNSER